MNSPASAVEPAERHTSGHAPAGAAAGPAAGFRQRSRVAVGGGRDQTLTASRLASGGAGNRRRGGRLGAALAARSSTTPTRSAALGSGLVLLALALLAFLAHVTVLSAVEHARSQRVAYAQFRAELSAVTAPTGQVDAQGQVLALGTPVAYLSVAGLGLEREIVFEGTTAEVLAQGPGHRRSSVLPGQPGISILYGRAWAYGGPFGGAKDLAVGSVITVTTGQGEHTYRVSGSREDGDPVPASPNVSDGEGRLTLVTAVGLPFAPSGAVYVDADLTSPAVPVGPRLVRTADLLPSEAALASDPAAWPIVFLLMQGLAAAAIGLTWCGRRWGARQTWLVGVPVLGVLGMTLSGEIMRIFPNLL